MSELEAAFWAGLAIFSPILTRIAWSRAVSLLSLSETAQELAGRLAPWIWGIGPAYLALISGAVPARFLGLTGHSPLAWFGGAIVCGALIGLAGLIHWPHGVWPTPTRGVLDEPRWALYRAAGILWISHAEIGLLIGLGLGLAEWGICYRAWQGPLRATLRRWRSADAGKAWPAGTWETLMRLASSSLIFALTRNFWLTALSQVVLLSMVRRKWFGDPPS